MTMLQDFLNTQVSKLTKCVRGTRAGDFFGLELECEGVRVDWDGSDPRLIEEWAPHRDGSLRDIHGSSCEWVFNGPVDYKKSVARVDTLFKYFQQRKARLVCSNRTSFHVHFNMGDKSAYQLLNLFILFTILEDILDRYCGEDRKGNLFCLSSRHAEEQVQWVQDAAFKHFTFVNFREDWRYCSLNLAAINKFGTVEFRAMRGLDNRDDVLSWLKIVNELCTYACYTMKNPVEVIENISQKTPKGFVREVFSRESADKLLLGMDENEINRSVFDGLRLVQMLSYRIGAEFDKVTLRGRDFWAAFSSDAPPVLDVNPQDFLGIAPVKNALPRFNNLPDLVPPVVAEQGPIARLVEEERIRARDQARVRDLEVPREQARRQARLEEDQVRGIRPGAPIEPRGFGDIHGALNAVAPRWVRQVNPPLRNPLADEILGE